MQILGVCGSLRAGSFNQRLLLTAQELAPSGMTISIAEIGQLPHYNQDSDGADKPAAVRSFKDQLRAADGLLIVSPEYNYSVPGVLKNAIDWASRVDPGQSTSPLHRKAVAIMGASMGLFGTLRGQRHLRDILLFPDCLVVQKPEVYVGQAQNKFDADGRLTDEATREHVAQLLAALAATVTLAAGRQ